MDYEPLEINDSDKSTKGGPPGWIAFSAILSAAAGIVLIAFLSGLIV